MKVVNGEASLAAVEEAYKPMAQARRALTRTFTTTSSNSPAEDCSSSSTGRSTRTRKCIRSSAGSTGAAFPNTSARRSCSRIRRQQGPQLRSLRARSRARRQSGVYRTGFGKPLEQIGAIWIAAMAAPLPPRVVEIAPCWMWCAPEPNSTSRAPPSTDCPCRSRRRAGTTRRTCPPGHFITKDPDTGVQNLGNYRGQLKAPRRPA